ncbi:MAG TPA: hypothetical protein VMZ50_13145, partial [Phycisphaerae bacterium]|nr:hypothetical protein [Phycisphaerae bacterium]
VRPDPDVHRDAWRAIEEVVAVTRNAATGAYRVACGSDWITWTPRKRPTGLLKRAIVAPKHFGDVLDATKLADAILEYDVAFSVGVEVTAAGWRFAAIRDVPLGLFLNDLIGRFGAGHIIRSPAPGGPSGVAIDLSAAQAVNGEINLDPNVAPAHYARLEEYGTDAVEQTAWNLAHDAAASDYSDSVYQVSTKCFYISGPNTWQAIIDRLGLEFDTSAYAAATAAKLVLVEGAKVGTPGVTYDTMNVADVTAHSAYPAILAAAVGSGRSVTDQGATWESDDLVANGLFAVSATFQLALIESNDGADTIPASEQRIIWSDGYLELTVPGPPPGSLATMGKGR